MDEKDVDREITKFFQSQGAIPSARPISRSIFDTGCSFHGAGIRCLTSVPNDDGTVAMPTSPAITCYAFAAELYIKALLQSDGVNAKGHKLHLLYGRLAPEIKDRVFAKYVSLLPGRTSEQFRVDLGQISNAFVDWRYIFEQSDIAIPLHRLVAFAWSLFSSIKDVKPNWSVQRDMDKRLAEKPDLSALRIIGIGGGRMLMLKMKN